MDELIKVVILGIIEGITEFLPISSTGHLIVATSFLDLRESLRGTFEIFIQIGAVFAVIAFYASDLWQQARSIRHDIGTRRLWLNILIAFIPAALLGLLFDDWIESVLFSPVVVALALIVGGIAFIVIERFIVPRQHPSATATVPGSEAAAAIASETATLEAVNMRQALIIGLWQTLALIPGMSRSGMSIIGGMLSGLNRTTATQFSFYLAIPTLGGATVYALLRDLNAISGDDLLLLFIGAAISGVVAWLSIAWLLRYISRNNFIAFGYYRIIVGVLILLLAAAELV